MANVNNFILLTIKDVEVINYSDYFLSITYRSKREVCVVTLENNCVRPVTFQTKQAVCVFIDCCPFIPGTVERCTFEGCIDFQLHRFSFPRVIFLSNHHLLISVLKIDDLSALSLTVRLHCTPYPGASHHVSISSAFSLYPRLPDLSVA